MAWVIGDTFGLYNTITDAALGHWDSFTGNASLISTTRFSVGKSFSSGSSGSDTGLVKSSGSNDATHHVLFSFMQSAGLSGTSLGIGFTLYDGATAQCSVVFRSDGAILFKSGLTGGSTLATFASAFSSNVWANFEFEITIHNTSGEIHIRKDGAGSDTFSSTSLNTRSSANNYANKVALTQGGNFISAQYACDFGWFTTSGAAPNTWFGDMRGSILLPASDNTVQMAGLAQTVTVGTGNTTTTRGANAAQFIPFTATITGTIGTATVNVNAGATANVKAAIYDSTGAASAAGTQVGSSATVLVNPSTGSNTITFSTPVPVVKGTDYWLGIDQDATITYKTGAANTGGTATITYASFPTVNPSVSGAQSVVFSTVNITCTSNASEVNESIHDDATTYVSDATVGHQDLYNMGDLTYAPATVAAVQSRVWMAKSDAGAKSAAGVIKSGATTVASATLSLSTSWQQTTRADGVDPATSSAWLVAAVNAIQCGGSVVA